MLAHQQETPVLAHDVSAAEASLPNHWDETLKKELAGQSIMLPAAWAMAQAICKRLSSKFAYNRQLKVCKMSN